MLTSFVLCSFMDLSIEEVMGPDAPRAFQDLLPYQRRRLYRDIRAQSGENKRRGGEEEEPSDEPGPSNDRSGQARRTMRRARRHTLSSGQTRGGPVADMDADVHEEVSIPHTEYSLHGLFSQARTSPSLATSSPPPASPPPPSSYPPPPPPPIPSAIPLPSPSLFPTRPQQFSIPSNPPPFPSRFFRYSIPSNPPPFPSRPHTFSINCSPFPHRPHLFSIPHDQPRIQPRPEFYSIPSSSNPPIPPRVFVYCIPV